MNIHVKTLHSFLLERFPEGLSSRDFTIFYELHPAAKSLKKNRSLKGLCLDYPNAFTCTAGQRDFIVKAILNPNSFNFLNYASKVAVEFFDQNLRHDITMRRKCEDRLFFEKIFLEWKSKQHAKGIEMTGCSPSTVLLHLKQKKILDSKADDGVLIWSQDLNMYDSKSPISREEVLKQARNRVLHGRDELEKNQNGVEIQSINFGYMDDKVISFGVPLEQNVTIENLSFTGTVRVELNSTLAERKGFRITGPRTAHLHKGDKIEVKLEVQPPLGVTRTLILFQFYAFDQQQRPIKPFTIVRYIDLKVGNPEDYELTKAKMPYKKKKIIPGDFKKPIPVHLPVVARGNFLNKLAAYGIPQYWRDAMQSKVAQDIFMELYYPEKRPEAFQDGITDHTFHLTFQNYGQIFKRLLWTEEFQMEVDIRDYDMTNVQIKKQSNRHFSLNIPGLAESRPSVLRGDLITVQLHSNKTKCFESYVDRVSLENAFLIFPHAFEKSFINGTRVDVRFHFRRVQLRTMHQSLNSLSEDRHGLLHRLLFPEPSRIEELLPTCITKPLTVESLNVYNKDLNNEQKIAVLGAMQSVARPSPYLIYGPPGTGKTVTVVETIIQIMKSNGHGEARMLVCAPSNAAVDIIVEKLVPYFSSKQLLRLIAYSREPKMVPAIIQKFATFDEKEDGYVAPPLSDLNNFKIIATTVSYAGKLFNMGVENHFTHIIIDEAGHAVEPEILSCVVMIAKMNDSDSPPTIVLAGDPKQLGPIIRNEVAKTFGLHQSMLERLSKREAYGKIILDHSNDELPTYDNRMITKLVKNYHSHPSILKLPNQFFYDNDLIPSSDLFRAYSLVKWEHLPTENFPIIFHGIQGADIREGNSPSWFNPDEASLVKHYVNLLVNETRTNRCEQCDIGVVTPYRKQVEKVRTLLKASHFQGVTVGSVEEFQGSERRVIIISTVRSSAEYLDSDNRHKLGFLSNPKRFNVALTRAQALLIVIGNPELLQHDKYWDTFIRFCKTNGGYVGCRYEPGSSTKQDDISDDTLHALAGLNLNDETDDNSDDFIMVSEVTAQEGAGWNFEE